MDMFTSNGRRSGQAKARRVALWSAVGVIVCATAARADTFTWTQISGGDASGDWNADANWNSGAGPIASGEDNVADFGTIDITAPSTVNLGGDQTIGSMSFGDSDTGTAANWTLSGGTLSLATSTGAPTITVNSTASGGAAISAGLTGNDGLSKAGAGTLILSGDNSGLSGEINVSAGTLNVGNTAALGGASGIRLSGGNLSFMFGSNNYAKNLTVTSNALLSGTNNNYLVTLGSLRIGAQLQITSSSSSANASYTFTGLTTLTGNTTFVITNGSSSITPSGNTLLLGGGLTVDAGVAVDSTTTATFRVDTSGVNRTRRFRVNGVISDAAPNKILALTLAAGVGSSKVTPTLTLTGVNTYTGLTTVQIGTLILDDGGSLATSRIALSGGNTFAPNGNSLYAGGRLAGGTNGAGGTVNYLVDGADSQAIQISNFGQLDLTDLKLAITVTDPTLVEYVIADKPVGSPNVIGTRFASVTMDGWDEWSISYTGTDLHPNSIVLSVPEPGGMSVLGLCLAGLLRRRKRA